MINFITKKMHYKQGDVILIPFPFTNLESIKTRPALVLKAGLNRDLIILAISSKSSDSNDYILNNSSLSKGFFPLQSYLKLDKVATLHYSLAKQIVASVKKEVFDAILLKFKDQF